MTKITRKVLTAAVSCNDLQYSKKTDTWIFRRRFYYTHGFTSDKWAMNISNALTIAGVGPFTVINHGEVWKVFRGGASVRAQSHWYATVRFAGEAHAG